MSERTIYGFDYVSITSITFKKISHTTSRQSDSFFMNVDRRRYPSPSFQHNRSAIAHKVEYIRIHCISRIIISRVVFSTICVMRTSTSEQGLYGPIYAAHVLTKVEQPAHAFMRFVAYGRSEPKCRNFASSSVLPGHTGVYLGRAATEVRNVKLEVQQWEGGEEGGPRECGENRA